MTTSSKSAMSPAHLGVLLAIGASLGLGAAVAFSRLAFEGGTDGLSVASVRAVGVVVLTGAIVLVMRRSFALSRRAVPQVIVLGILVAHMFYGNIAAVQYIPVGMTALLFFIYPPLVAVILVVGFGAKFSAMKAIAALTAFVGLGVALGVSFVGLRWEGVVLATTSGMAAAVNAVWIGQRLRQVDPFVLTFYMGAIAAVVLWVLLLARGGLTLPETELGWTGAGLVVACQVFCVPMYFISIRFAGPELATMVTNVQPIASIVLAFLLYGEVLTVAQGIGGAMVIGGIFLMQWQDRATQSRGQSR